MKNIADLLFEAKMLKEIPRSGYHFLGVGKESVAEHCFMTTFIAYVMSKKEPGADALRLIEMCAVHDLPESRIGDLNYVQKNYVTPDEEQAITDATGDLPLGPALADLIHEFNEGKTKEAKLARDADQLALVLELKALMDIGYTPPKKWLPFVIERLETETGKDLCESILSTTRDAWWFKNSVDSTYRNQ
ncbi:MAG: HD domain-containing protein [Deltaproteobacteria bacterium]|nr:HD domain-containing protein [Deltaproteobacteria bacterium]